MQVLRLRSNMKCPCRLKVTASSAEKYDVAITVLNFVKKQNGFSMCAPQQLLGDGLQQ